MYLTVIGSSCDISACYGMVTIADEENLQVPYGIHRLRLLGNDPSFKNNQVKLLLPHGKVRWASTSNLITETDPVVIPSKKL